MREKMHYEGYMQMNRRNPTPYMEKNEYIKKEKEMKAKAKQDAENG